MPNRTIPVGTANAMVQQYLKYIGEHGIDSKTQTHNVAFSTPELLSWMDRVKGTTDEFRVCMGVYPTGHQHAGKITAIIWPYKGGKPSVKPTAGKGGDDDFEDPYNEGSLTP